MKIYFASIALLFAACSSDPLAPGAGSDPGTGTNTLAIEGNANASPRAGSGKLAADFETDFSIRISLNNVAVTTGAVVQLQSQNVTVALTFDPNGGGNGGRWVGTAAGYDEVYRLDVTSGVDKVTGVIVDGPDIHQITDPLAGASLDSTMPYTVKWQRGEEADTATFRVGDINGITIADSGTYAMPAASLRAEKDRTRENTIEITRSNHIAPAGAIGGSNFTVSVSNDLTVLAQPNPAL